MKLKITVQPAGCIAPCFLKMCILLQRSHISSVRRVRPSCAERVFFQKLIQLFIFFVKFSTRPKEKYPLDSCGLCVRVLHNVPSLTQEDPSNVDIYPLFKLKTFFLLIETMIPTISSCK